MSKKYRIQLTAAERQELETLIAAGKAAVTKRQRAQILLASDENHPAGALPDTDIARALGVNLSTVERARRNLWEHGLEMVVEGWPVHRKVSRVKVDGWTEAHLVSLQLVESISPATVGRALKKRAQTLADSTVVPAAGKERRRCARDRGRAPRL